MRTAFVDTLLRVRRLRQLERRAFPFLETLVDYDVVLVIGAAQRSGAPMTLKLLLAEGISSASTIQRRLRRLERLGAVIRVRSILDRRVWTLGLSPGVFTAYSRIGRRMRELAR